MSQLLLVAMIAVFNVLLAGGVFYLARSQACGGLETIWMELFSLLVFNGPAYAYFHFFNMSETARRIRIILEIRQDGPVAVQDLLKRYSPRDMLSVRLQRLEQGGQIRQDAEGRYRLRGKFLLNVAKSFRLARKILV